MYRNKTCGELNLLNVNEEVIGRMGTQICKMGGITFIDLRDSIRLPSYHLMKKSTLILKKPTNWDVNG